MKPLLACAPGLLPVSVQLSSVPHRDVDAVNSEYRSEMCCMIVCMWTSSIYRFSPPLSGNIKACSHPNRLFLPLELPLFHHPPSSVLLLHSAATAIMSEKRRSSSIDRSSGSDIHEKGLHQDLVSATTSPSPSLSYTPRRMPWLRKWRPSSRISWRLLLMPGR